MKRKTKSLLCLALSLCLLLSAAPLRAFAVKQEDIDALKAKRDAIQAQRLEKQAVVDRLEADQANVLEQKRALDERNLYTFQQIQLNDEEIALYDEMIAEKEEELLGAEKLEKEQLERYRARVRAMEENGTLNYLAMILKANNLGELLSAIDDIGEIMQSDRKLEDAYIQAREVTEEVKAEYEEYRAEINGKQDALRKEKMQLEAELEEASQLLLSIQQDLENRQAEYDAIMAEEERTEAAIDKLVAQLEAERAEAARRAAEEAPPAEAPPTRERRAPSSSRSPPMSTYPAASASACIPSPASSKTTTAWTSPPTWAPPYTPPTAVRSCWPSGTAATATAS